MKPRLLSLLAFILVWVSQAPAPGQGSVPPLGSFFASWESLGFKPTPVGLLAPVCDGPTPALPRLEIHVTRLRPGMASHPPHHHPNEEIFIVKEGQLDVSINGRHERAGPGGMVFIASNDLHNVTNVGPSLATYTVVSFHTSLERGVGDRPAAEWAPKAMLSSRVIDPGKVPSVATPIGFHSSLVDSPTLTFRTLESHLTTLGPGKGTAPRNRIPGDELFIVLQGTLRATLNGVSRTLGPGSLYYVAPNDERTMSNPGTEPCTYQVIRVVSDRTPAPAAGRPS